MRRLVLVWVGSMGPPSDEGWKVSVEPTIESTVNPTSPDGPTGQLASWAANFTIADAPLRIRERAKDLVLDGLGCALIGAQLPWSRTAVDAVLKFEGSGTSPLIGWGTSTSAPAAALLNSTFIQGFELDDFHPLAPLHSASLVIPTLLAALPFASGVDGARFLAAAIVGFEVGPRVGLALHGSEMLSRGWHSGPVFGTHASAAAVGNLLGLDAGAMEDALGLAATQSSGLMAAQFGAMSKRMQHGFAARNGMYAALLALGGYTGIKEVYEQPYGGFLSTFGEGHEPDIDQITSELGERWETERIVVKPYAAMGGLHAALDALFEIAALRPLVAEEIEHIDVELSDAVYHHGWWPPERPLTPTSAQMNIAYSLAVGVLDGVALVQQYAPGRMNRDDIWELIPRIAAHHNAEFDRLGSMGRGQTKLSIRFTDGSRSESSLFAARSVLNSLTRDEIVAKYRSLTENVLEDVRREQIEHAVLGLESAPDLDELLGLLADPVSSPFSDASGG
jgi:aconitate decarboxylase